MFRKAQRATDIELVADKGMSLAEDVLRFLAANHLEPAPPMYELGYLYCSNPRCLASRSIDAIVMNGDRLTKAQAEHIIAAHIHLPAPPDGADRDAMRLQAMKLSTIAANTLATTGKFGRDLAETLNEAPEAVDVFSLVSSMIEHSKQAETALNKAAQEIEALRQEVDAAKSDAARDALTGLLNRRGLEAELRKSPVTGRSALAICDIDKFKSVNDRYGHVVGDRVIKLVATALTDSCGSHLVARWGGEEFIIVMRDVAVADAAGIVDRAREALTKRTVRLRETDEPIGIISYSAGVAPVETSQIDAAVAQADELLYRAKANGRNRVET